MLARALKTTRRITMLTLFEFREIKFVGGWGWETDNGLLFIFYSV